MNQLENWNLILMIWIFPVQIKWALQKTKRKLRVMKSKSKNVFLNFKRMLERLSLNFMKWLEPYCSAIAEPKKTWWTFIENKISSMRNLITNNGTKWKNKVKKTKSCWLISMEAILKVAICPSTSNGKQIKIFLN